MSATIELPESIRSEEDLEELLSRPRAVLSDAVRRIEGPLVVLGASGKMGPTLCVLARRAADLASHPLRVVAVSRFTDTRARRWLESRGVETIACDLLNPDAVRKLPDSTNLVYLVGMKFGTAENPALTWAVNTLIPSYVVTRYAKARIVALSTGNVYPYTTVASQGAIEQTLPAPVGEYGITALARERMFEYGAQTQGASVVLLRLNYAVELRYGVLADIARRIWTGQVVDVTTGYLNCIWQADANEFILRSLGYASVPPAVYNLTGSEIVSVRELAEELGRLLGKAPTIHGVEAQTALLSNPAKLCAQLGQPPTPIDRAVRWTAAWIREGGADLGKPTHFEERSGRF